VCSCRALGVAKAAQSGPSHVILGAVPASTAAAPRVLVIAPPFLSHARPAAILGSAISAVGGRVVFGCTSEFSYLADQLGMEFFSFEGATNRNTGRASATRQPDRDRDRLQAFLRATRQSAVAALTVQARNRRDDMFQDPERVMADVARMCGAIKPDWCLVDQLSYPVTLALHRLGIMFASFVVGHPTDLPDKSVFGVPARWPDAISVSPVELGHLVDLAVDVERTLTRLFNKAVGTHAGSPVPFENAFSYSSCYARVFNYPEDVSTYPVRPGRDLFMGHSGTAIEELPPDWTALMHSLDGRPRVLISFGTFQWVHTDIMRKVQRGIRNAFPDSTFIVAAGCHTSDLADLADSHTRLYDFIPQPALTRHVDLIVHHGGNNSFTEAVASAVPSIVLPFASDQFAVARDVHDNGLGRVLDPNNFAEADVADAARAALDGRCASRVRDLAKQVGERGPLWAATQLMGLMDLSAGRRGL
jgi:UDP:flavonoid glycosyltransferase YjiC (YdhE family)